MMQNKTMGALALAGMLGSGMAGAQELSYNYVEGGLALYPDFGDQSLVGIDTNARFAFTDEIFGLGGFQYLTDDVDVTTFHVGAGYRFPIQRGTDVWGGLTIEYNEIESTRRNPFTGQRVTTSVDDTSLGIRGGVRHMVNRDLEVSGTARLITGDLDYFGLRGSATYFLQQNLGIVGSVDLFDGDLGLIGSARYNF